LTTNAHGLYARRTDGDTEKSVFFRCIFHWFRNSRLIDIMAVGGSGGHFSPDYFDYLSIPRFPREVQQEVCALYHNDAQPPPEKLTTRNFVEWHRKWNCELGVWQLDREMKRLQSTLAAAHASIIEDKAVAVPL
jgi:hypothetical protein